MAVSAIPYLEREGRWGRIVEVAEKAAEELDCVTTEVTSARCRVESRPFYQSLGFEEWDDRSVRYLKDPVPGPLKHWSLVDAGSRSAVAGS